MCSWFGGDDGGTQTVVQQANQEPWSGQQPYLERGFGEAEQVLDTPQSYFPGTTVVPFSNQTEQALQSTENLATAGNPNQAAQTSAMAGLLGPNQNPAMSMYQDVAGGSYQGGNPAYDAMVNRIQSTVAPSIDSGFAGSGRYGSGAHTEAKARGMADAIAPLAFQNYENERGRQMQALQGLSGGYGQGQQAQLGALSQAPAQNMARYADAAALGGVGQQREGLAQSQLQDAINRWNFSQQEPTNRLGNYMGLVGGGYGTSGTTQTTSPTQSSNPLMQLLGIGSTGMGLATGARYMDWI